jgi:hypothetical protein
MASRALAAAGVAAILAITTPVLARAPAPLVPTAVVEDVKSATADVEFMDYVGRGQVIRLGPTDVLTLSYLKSCEHETITGGTVTVGAERSDVREGQVVRNKVACNGGKMQLTSQQASQSAATAFRLQSADGLSMLYSRTPMVQLPKIHASENRTLLIARADRRGERYELKIDDASAAAGFFDLARAKVSLAPGATYVASLGDHEVKFQINGKAKSGPAPIVSRLLRFQ